MDKLSINELDTNFEKNGIRIFALNEKGLQLFLKNKKKFLLKYDLPPQNLEDTEELIQISLKMCLPNMRKNPDSWPYFTRWMAVDTRFPPRIVAELLLISGLDSSGAVEIGYGVLPEFENKGYMTRAIDCFLAWAAQNPAIKRVKAETDRTNLASIRVLVKNNFVKFVELDAQIWWVKTF